MSSVKSPGRSRRPLIALIGLVCLIAGGIYAWQQLRPAPEESGRPSWRGGGDDKPVPVRIAVAKREPLAVNLKALGTVTPLNTVTIRSRIEGELVEVSFTEGQRVEAGDSLARIDPRAYQVQLDRAEGTRQQNIAELTNAQSDLQRYRDLQEKGYVSGQQLSGQEALVRQYEARRKTDQANVDDARLQLSYTRITAPIDGKMGLRAVDVGNLVGMGDADGIATITQMSPTSVLFTIPEVELPDVLDAVRESPTLAVEAWDRADRTRLATGNLSSVDNRIDTSTGTLRLRAKFENLDESLYPNQFVNVRLKVSSANAIVIPNAAIQFGSKGNFVFVVGPEDKVEIRTVKLGNADGERIAVIEGIAEGERVVLEGLDRLREGSTAEIIADTPADGPDA